MPIQLNPAFPRPNDSNCDPENTELVCNPLAVAFFFLLGGIVLFFANCRLPMQSICTQEAQ